MQPEDIKFDSTTVHRGGPGRTRCIVIDIGQGHRSMPYPSCSAPLLDDDDLYAQSRRRAIFYSSCAYWSGPLAGRVRGIP